MRTAADLVQQITAAYPHLVIENAALLPGGQYNTVLRVNEDMIFRFPRFAAEAEKLAREVLLLDSLRPYLSLRIPKALYCHFETSEGNNTFAGYRVIRGEPLRREVVAALDEVAKASVATQLTTFLRELHAIPYRALGWTTARTDDTAIANWRTSWSELLARLRAAIFPRIPSAVRTELDTHFSDFLADEANFSFVPCFIHGDFGTGNILFEQTTGVVTGIIDFDSGRLGDPACDLAALLTYDEQFTRQILMTYAPTSAELSRARFYRATFAAQEALYGAEHDDPAAFARGIAPYLIAQDSDRHD